MSQIYSDIGLKKMKYLMIACLILCCCFLPGCHKASHQLSGGAYSRETHHERKYIVSNDYHCPAYNEGRWGVVFLEIADVTEQDFFYLPFEKGLTITSGKDFYSVDIHVDGKSISCKFEKNFVNVYFNDESGVYRLARFEMNDPQIDCLFYKYDKENKENRAEMVDLWLQLIADKDHYPAIFEALKSPTIR
jgi:hypothetical protein